jgi:hypothetical protein
VFSFAGWLQQMRVARGMRHAHLLRIPFPLALTLARLGQGIHPMLHPDNLYMLKAGYCADVGPFAEFLGRLPLYAVPHLFFCEANTP